MGIEESTIIKGVLEGLKSGTKDGYITTLERFVNEFAKDMTVEQLFEEAKSNVKKTQKRIDCFFQWLQDEKGISHNSARIYAYGYLRGFFSNLDIHFERKWRRNNPKPTANHAIKGDKAYTFFYVDAFISMLYVKEDFRRKGIGTELMKYIESKCKREKLFISTNQSNKPMQSLLKKLRYERSGIIHNLDPGDPELIYFKRITHR